MDVGGARCRGHNKNRHSEQSLQYDGAQIAMCKMQICRREVNICIKIV